MPEEYEYEKKLTLDKEGLLDVHEVKLSHSRASISTRARLNDIVNEWIDQSNKLILILGFPYCFCQFGGSWIVKYGLV